MIDTKFFVKDWHLLLQSLIFFTNKINLSFLFVLILIFVLSDGFYLKVNPVLTIFKFILIVSLQSNFYLLLHSIICIH